MAFAKGKSGNPSGRPKEVLELVRLARSHCGTAIKRAEELLQHKDGKVAMSAAVFLRDTGMGRPAQVELELAQVSDDALIAEVKRRAALAAANTTLDVTPERHSLEEPKPALDGGGSGEAEPAGLGSGAEPH